MLRMGIMFSIGVCICMHACVCICANMGVHPHPHPPTHPGVCQMTKNAINPELINIIQFCLKICELWRLPHPCVGVGVGAWMGGLSDGVMSNH